MAMEFRTILVSGISSLFESPEGTVMSYVINKNHDTKKSPRICTWNGRTMVQGGKINNASTQFRFRNALGTWEALFSQQVLFQRCRDMNNNIHVNFIDYQKASDGLQLNDPNLRQKKSSQLLSTCTGIVQNFAN